MEDPSDNFLTYFELNNFDHNTMQFILTYYAVTTLSTVGFGDFYPRSDIERVTGTLYMFIGVVLFSYLLDRFSLTVENFKFLLNPLE
jgi:hypothetical protein